MQPRKLPPQELLRELFDYDEWTGFFRRRAAPSRIAGTVRKYGYIFVGVRGYGQLGAHRLAWIYVYGPTIGGAEIDHIDGNPSNNAIANLRLATSRQQKHNKRVQSNNRAGLKGAYYHACRKGKKWRSQIKVGDKLYFLGYFDTAEEAHAAYGIAAKKYFGEFARAAVPRH